MTVNETKPLDVHDIHVPYGPPYHTWELTESGRVDQFALDVDFIEGWGGHNGPHCTVCNEYFCEHCHPDVFEELCPGG